MFSGTRVISSIVPIVLLVVGTALSGQQRSMEQDPGLDNLVHPEGYRTVPLGTFGHVEKRGRGPVPMVLIPGGGFGWQVFEDFMAANADRYTMFAVSLPGMGGTQAPPMPPEGTSYGEQTWIRGAIAAAIDLIEREKLDRPVLVGHFMEGSQIGLRIAIDHADKVRGVVLAAGTAKMSRPGQQYTLEQTIRYLDTTMAPEWFKTVTRKTWNDNNFPPESYSRDPERGKRLFGMVSQLPLPVVIRYLVEFWSSDLTLEFEAIKTPVLVLTPSFDEALLAPEANPWLAYYFTDCWKGVETNPLVEVLTVDEAHIFVWLDQPAAVQRAIDAFANTGRR